MGNRYQEFDIRTASPEWLVVKLYAGALQRARQAREHHAAGRLAERGVALSKAIAIVGELQSALDMDGGGEIARQLHSLYSFVNERLVDANLRGRPESIDEAMSVLSTLREAWEEIARPSSTGAGAP